MSVTHFTSHELIAATHGKLTGTMAVTGISKDTRTLKPGDLYVAIKGESFDGHDFCDVAQKAGAAGVLVEREVATSPRLLVTDSLAALTGLGIAARERHTGHRYAVTGSSGKTTTKEMLRHTLAAFGPVHASLGSDNNEIGVPFTLARLPATAPHAVFELAMRGPHQIAPLSALVRPHTAIITTIGQAHIEFFPESGELGIARTKAEIFMGLEKGGSAIIPADSPHSDLLKALAAPYRTLTFGHGRADAEIIERTNEQLQLNILGKRVSFRPEAKGAHMAANMAAVLLAVAAAGLDIEKAATALASFVPVKGRGLVKQFHGITIMDDCYNANPQSMAAAIALLGETPAPRRVAVIGPMYELGPFSAKYHAELAVALTAAKVDLVFAAGQENKEMFGSLPATMKGSWAETASALAPVVANAVKAGDMVLIKGSRGELVNINGVPSPSMSVIIEAIANREVRHAV